MTSGPQDPQHGRQGEQQPYGSRPPYEQSGYGQPSPYGPSGYGQQSPYGQPGWSPYPSGPGYGQPAGYDPAAGYGPPTPRPRTVTAGVAAFAANAVLSILGTVIGFADVDSLVDQAAAGAGHADFSGLARIFTILGLGLSLLVAAFLLGMAWMAWRGANWARIVLWVFGGLGLFFGLLGLITSTGVLAVLGGLQLLLLAAGVVLLALRPSNEWYRSESRRRRGLPG